MAHVLAAPRGGARAERTFYLGVALTMAAGIVAGFAPTWFLRPWMYQEGMVSLTPWIWLHGLVFSAWLALFVTQVSLISAGNRALHQRLGLAGFAFALLLPVIGLIAGLHGAARHAGPPMFTPQQWLAVPVWALLAPLVLLPLALANRRRDLQAHKRYMILAMVPFVSPGFGRIGAIPLLWGLTILPMLFVAALAAWDLYSRGRLHRGTVIGGAVAFVATCVAPMIWTSPAWTATANALIGIWPAA